MFRVAVLISGRGSNLAALLSATEQPNCTFSICAVISDKKEALGLEKAQAYGVPTFVVERRKEERTLAEFFHDLGDTIAAQKPDLIVLAGFMRIIPEGLIRRFEGKMINIHPSLLPAFKGMHAQRQALEAGVSEAGCTVHWVVPDVDAGEILAQAKVPVLPGDTEETLSARILKEEHRLLPQVVQQLAEGQL